MSSGPQAKPIDRPEPAERNAAEQLIIAKKRIDELEDALRRIKFGSPSGMEALGQLRKKAEFDAILEGVSRDAPYPICVFDLKHRILHRNPAFSHMFVWSSENPYTPRLKEMFPEGLLERIIRASEELLVFAAHKPLFWQFSSKGVGNIYRVRLHGIKNEQMQIYAFVLCFYDVSDQYRQIEELEASESRLRNIVEKTDSLVLQLDSEFRLDFVNPSSLKYFGLDATRYRGVHVLDLIHAEDEARVERALLEYTAAEEAHFGLEFRLPNMHGEDHVIHWSFQAQYSADRELLHLNGIGRDITRHRELEHRLTVAKETAEAADRSKSEFLAMISHEIRTPLNSVIGLSDLLCEADLGQEEKTMVETISSSGESLLALINDVLDLSKVEAGRMAISHMEFDIRECLEQLHKLYEYRLQSSNLSFVVTIDPDVPQIVRLDRDRLMQILNNLLSNATKFTLQGQVRLKVRAECLANLEEFDLWQGNEDESSKPYRLYFDVEDTGIGISPEQRVLLFQPFSQADPSIRKRFGGTGLGLVISRKLAHLMEGDIELESEMGKGSKFTLHVKADGKNLSVRTTAEPAPSSTQTRRSFDRSLAERYPLDIMVVDDVSHNRLVMKTLLKRMGYDPVVLSSAEEALAFLDSGSMVDLIFMDMLMPEMSGPEATKEIRYREQQDGRRHSIVAITANASAQDRQECEESGMDGFITKPIRFSVIQDYIIAAKKGL